MKFPNHILPHIVSMQPYRPGRPVSEVQRQYGLKKVVKLASNESPFGVSPKVLAALAKAQPEIIRYPDPTHFDLLQALHGFTQVSVGKIAVGNGSDELFDQMMRIFCEPGSSILTGKGAFSAYQISAHALGLRVIFAESDDPFYFDLNAFDKHLTQSIDSERIRMVFIPNPNNPTGTHLPSSDLEAFIRKWGSREDLLVVVDEAYVEFPRASDYSSTLAILSEVPNLVVSRTFSKAYALAGLRLGFAMGPEWLVDLINRLRKPFNVNGFAQVAAVAALEDVSFMRAGVSATWKSLDLFYTELTELGLSFVPSQGNFVLFKTPDPGPEVFKKLLALGLILRPVDNYGFSHHLRLSVGTAEENDFAVEALKTVFKGGR